MDIPHTMPQVCTKKSCKVLIPPPEPGQWDYNTCILCREKDCASKAKNKRKRNDGKHDGPQPRPPPQPSLNTTSNGASSSCAKGLVGESEDSLYSRFNDSAKVSLTYYY